MSVMLKKEEILGGSRKYKQPDHAKGNAVSRLRSGTYLPLGKVLYHQFMWQAGTYNLSMPLP